MKKKSEVATKFAEFVALAETQTGNRVKTLICDNGGEYTAGDMVTFCTKNGIVESIRRRTHQS